MTDDSQRLTPEKRALMALRKLQARLDAVEQARCEPIAIIGMACRFPGGANDPESFWRLLCDGTDTIREVPPERWDLERFYDPNPDTPDKLATRWGGFVDQVDGFDAGFFGISPREAAGIDPQQRLLLEVAWEALERAGQPAARLAGSRTGVFVGLSNSDYLHLHLESKPIADAYLETGNRHSFAAGRLSYLLDLRGPSVAIDTVCSSSLAAVHLAVQSLRAGESELALAGGVNLIVSPIVTVMATKWGMLAADGRCKTFDARANGFVRSEGCGVVVLKRLSDALRDGDPVLALIRGSAVNQDGKSAGLTAPNGQAQQALIRQALESARVDPALVGYVETHGTGTSLGDPIEVEALASVYGRAGAAEQPCYLGAVKTNIGHLEAAAGVAGLIKAVMALRQGQIPGNLHLQTLNPHIRLEQTRLRLPSGLLPWAADQRPRLAAVSSFGFSGTNVHVVLEEHRPAPAPPAPAPAPRELLLPLSARSPRALEELAGRYQTLLDSPQAPALPDLAASAATRRSHHSQRLALVCRDARAVAGLLGAFARGERPPGLAVGEARPSLQRRVVFVFPGQGSQWLGMGRELLEQEPVFRTAIEACAAACAAYVEWSLIDELRAAPEQSHLDQIDVVQPLLFAVQVALAALWRSWGVHPAAVVGHSMGEVAAAHVAGILSLDDAARIICRRSRLLRRIRGQGAMLLAELSAEEAAQALAPHAERVSVAVCNSARSTVLAGDAAALEQLRAGLDARGVFSRWVKVDVASHSPQVDPLCADLLDALDGLRPAPAALPLYSTVTNRTCAGPELDAHYWVSNLREPVLFGAAVARLIDEGLDCFVEISAHPVLLPAVQQNMRDREADGLALGSLQREAPERATLLGVLAELYAAGMPLEWPALVTPGARPVDLPLYPWQRQRCWVEPAAPTAGLPSRGRAAAASHPLLGAPIRLAHAPALHAWEQRIDLERLPFLADHVVQDVAVLPAAAYLELGLAAARAAFGPGAHTLADLALHQVLALTPAAPLLQVILSGAEAQAASAEIAIYSRPDQPDADPAFWTLHARMRAVRGGAPAVTPPVSIEHIRAACAEQRSGEAHYRALAGRGLRYGPAFRGVQALWRRDGEALARVELPGAAGGAGAYQIHPALLDACLQVNEAAAPDQAALALPVALGALQPLRPVGAGPVWVHARQQPDPQAPDERLCTIALLDDQGGLLLRAEGLRMRPLAAEEHTDDPIAGWLYARRWQALPPAPAPTPSTPAAWLIFADQGGLAQALQTQLSARGDTALLATPAGADLPAGALSVHPDQPADYLQALQSLGRAGLPACRDVVYLWGLEHEPSDPERGWRGALLLTQALIQSGLRSRLWLVTRGAQAAGPDQDAPAPAQALLWGLGLTVAQEHPELRCTRLDLDERPADAAAAALIAEADAPGFEDQIALRPAGRLAARMLPWQPAESAPEPLAPAGARDFRLEIDRPGVLDRLTLRAGATPAPGPGQVAIAVEAAGLNFLDVLLALGVIPESPGLASPRLGGECAGRVVALGPGVDDLHLGQEVLALAPGSFASTVLADRRLVAPKPAHFSFEEAATLPVAFLTAFYALEHVARLEPGERVLIHAASGGVGLAALQLALRRGAQVYATAGSPEKRQLLLALGATHVADSRSLGFAEDIRAATGGEGVDVVINSLAGEFIDASLGLLRPYGRFIELGKRDYFADRKLGLKPFLNNLSFSLVDLRGMQEQRPALVGRLLRELLALFEQRVLGPILWQTLPVARVGEAFQQMAQGRHTGKIAISFAERAATPIAPARPAGLPLRADACYLITGGLGGIGLRLAGWLAEQGARQLALLGRRAPDPAAQAALEALRARGVTVLALQADVAEHDSLAAALAQAAALAPLRGVFHAAAVLDDATLPRLDPERFRRALAPKLQGAWHLHELTAGQPLDHFVLFSSVAALIGSPGQANYAAANAALDALAQHRRARGLPALSINWGAWAEVGLAAAQSNRGERLAGQGVESFTPEQGLAALGRLLGQPEPQLAVLRFNLRQWQQAHPGAAAMPLLQALPQHERQAARASTSAREQLQAAEPAQRRALLETLLREQVAHVLRQHPDQINPRAPLGSIGFDSLLALELRNRLEALLELELPGTLIWSYPTIAALAPYLAERIGLDLERPPAPAAQPAPAAADTPEEDQALAFLSQQLLDDLDQLSDEDVRRMLTNN